MIVISIAVLSLGILFIHVADTHKSIFMMFVGWCLVLMGFVSMIMYSVHKDAIDCENKGVLCFSK